MLLTAMGIAARTYTLLQEPGTAGKGRVPECTWLLESKPPNELPCVWPDQRYNTLEAALSQCSALAESGQLQLGHFAGAPYPLRE